MSSKIRAISEFMVFPHPSAHDIPANDVSRSKLREARHHILKKDFRSLLVARAPWMKSRRIAGDLQTVRDAGLFDETYYRSQLPAGFIVKDPLIHYLVVGARWGVSPHPLFDSDWYTAQSPELANLVSISPLVHYLRFGARLGYNPNPVFDTAWYAAQNQDALKGGLNPLSHFDRIGWKELRDPSPDFSVRNYLAAYPDVRHLGINPLRHYLTCVRPWQSAVRNIHLAPPAEAGDFVFWGMFPWFFTRQRPQHLAASLAQAGYRIFYVENVFERAAEPGFSAQPLDQEGRLFRIQLQCRAGVEFYTHPPGPEPLSQLRGSLACLLRWARLHRPISLVQHVFWNELARWIPNGRVVYDCFDFHQGFDRGEQPVLEAEADLFREADLVVASSGPLRDFAERNGARNVAVIRNAADFDHFASAPVEAFKDRQGRKTIGYFGAISAWLDLELVARVARAYPQCRVVLIGRDEVHARRALARCANVECKGEVPYAELSAHLHGFDVAMIPFKLTPLTLAINPVKVYEYLSAGRPVVSVNLPELRQFGDVVQTAETPERFIELIGAALTESANDAGIDTRRQFAAFHTWRARTQDLLDALTTTSDVPVTVMVLAADEETGQECLADLKRNTDYGNAQLVMARRSHQGSPAPTSQIWQSTGAQIGFSALQPPSAAGEYVALVDSRTRVQKGWLRTLVHHLRRNPRLGLISALDNQVGHELGLEIACVPRREMADNILAFTSAHLGELFERECVPLHCVAIPRAVLEKVLRGTSIDELDPRSLCARTRELGYQVGCAKDVFVSRVPTPDFDQRSAPSKLTLFGRGGRPAQSWQRERAATLSNHKF